MAIMLGACTLATARVTAVAGAQVLGAHRIQLCIEFRSTQHVPDGGIRLVGSRCHVQSIGKGPAGDLGWLDSDGTPIALHAPNSIAAATFVADLPHARLEALEANRAGELPQLQVRLTGSVITTSGLPVGFNEAVDFRPSRDEWLTALESSGYRRLLIVEVAIPFEGSDAQGGPHMFLSQANKAMRDGRWRDCVSACRDALEQLAPADGFGQQEEKLVNDLLGKSKSWDKDQRFMAIRKALTIVTHAAKHADEITAGIQWDRVDAQSVVAITSLLAMRFPPMKPSTGP